MLKSFKKLVFSFFTGMVVIGILFNGVNASAATYTNSANANDSYGGTTLRLTSSPTYYTANPKRWSLSQYAVLYSGNGTSIGAKNAGTTYSSKGSIESVKHTVKGTFYNAYQYFETPGRSFNWNFDYNNKSKGIYLR